MKHNYIEILRIKMCAVTHDTFLVLRKSFVRVVIALECYLCESAVRSRNSNTPTYEDIQTAENKIKPSSSSKQL